MVVGFGALAVAGLLAMATTPAPVPQTMPTAFEASPIMLRPLIDIGAPPSVPAVLTLDASRLALGSGRSAPSGMMRFAAGLGADLAWDLSDLPRRHARLPDPIGGFRPGAAFRAHLADRATREGGAIGALISCWNTLYPPYALAHDREVLNDH